MVLAEPQELRGKGLRGYQLSYSEWAKYRAKGYGAKGERAIPPGKYPSATTRSRTTATSCREPHAISR